MCVLFLINYLFLNAILKIVLEEVVVFRDGKYLTLGEVFKSLGKKK